MLRYRALALALVLVGALLAACAPVATDAGGKPRVIMGSANFSEQVVLGEVYAQALEAAGYTVDRKLNLGSREILAPALERGEVNIYPEYLATYLTYLTKDPGRAHGDPAITHRNLQDALNDKNLAVLDYAQAQDQNVFVVTKQISERHGIKKVSDISKVNGQLTLGGPPTCPERPYCLIGLQNVYGLRFKEFKPLDTGGPITIQSLEGNQIDVALLFSSNPQIALKGFVPLDDDKQLQRSDNIAPVVRRVLLDSAPADFRTTLNAVSAKLTTPELMDLNKGVDVDKREAKDVAAAWLRAKGLVR